MESMLVVITAVAVAAALILGGVVVKLARDERRRSAARVALLASLTAETPAVPRDNAADLSLRYTDVAEPAPGLFAPPVQRSAWPRRAAIGAALAGTLFGVGVGLRTVGRVGGPPAGSAVRASNVPQLDLLSLKHAQEGDTMTITGLVHNPASGPALPRVVATALLFDGEGAFLASGRAPLDFDRLGPNAESGFTIKVPVNTAVARYRIGFRAEDGRVIGHVDRRSTRAIARGPS
jgi:hypothetical protein